MATRTTTRQEESLRRASTRLTPVWPNLPTANAFRPIVALIVVAFPGLVGFYYGHLTPTSAFWGVSAQRVLAGDVWLVGESPTLPADDPNVASDDPATTNVNPAPPIPPFFPWCTARVLATGWANPITLLSVPSYVFWLLSALVLYRLLRFWFDENTALLTCLLVAVNPVLVRQVQQGEPGPCVLFWCLVALWAYAEHFQSPRDRPWIWRVLGGLAFGALVLTVGLSAAWLPLLALCHLLYEQVRTRNRDEALAGQILVHPSLTGGVFVLAIAAIIAFPWIWSIGWDRFLIAGQGFPARTTGSGLVKAMPATLILAIFGWWLTARQRIRRAGPMRRTSIPLFWSFLSLAAFFTIEPTASGLLLACVPLTLMAVRVLDLVVERRLSDRISLGLMLVTFWTFVLSLSPTMVKSSATVVSAWLAEPILPERVDVEPQLGWRLLEIHLAIDVMIVGTVLLLWLYRLSGRKDRFRRALFGGFATAVVLFSTVVGAAQLTGPLRISDPWASFYTKLAQRREQYPFDWYVLLGHDPPSISLEFVSRALSGNAKLLTANDLSQLQAIFDKRSGSPLVLYTERRRTPPEKILQSRGDSTVTLRRLNEVEVAVAYFEE